MGQSPWCDRMAMMQIQHVISILQTTSPPPPPPPAVTALGEPSPLPQLPSTVLDPATHVSSSSPSRSSDLPQLTQATSTKVVINVELLLFLRTVSFLQGPSSCILQRCPATYIGHQIIYHDYTNIPLSFPTATTSINIAFLSYKGPPNNGTAN